ncbi:MAG: co-chaperone GroES family protein [Chlorobiota bacterium]
MLALLERVVVVGDRVLIRPRVGEVRTKSGLYLPPGVRENERVQTGYVVKVGPGYLVPAPPEWEEPWKPREVHYLPLQAREGDLAIYLQRDALELELEGERYVVVPHTSILLLIRDEELLEG